MSQPSPVHITGATNNSDGNIAAQKSKNVPKKQQKKRQRVAETKARAGSSTADRRKDQDSDSGEETPEENVKKRTFSTPNRGKNDGDSPLFSLPSQNLDASIHAPYNNIGSFQIPIFGNMPSTYFPYSPSPMGFPYYNPLLAQAPNEGKEKAADSEPQEKLAQEAETGNSQQGKEKKNTGTATKKKQSNNTYAGMAKYALGKPTYSVDEPTSSVYQSASQNALIYNIAELAQVPANQIISSVNLQMGKAIYGAKIKFTNNKRSHLELAFFSSEAMETWAKKDITLIGKNFTPIKAHNGKKSFFSITLSGVPLCDKTETTNVILRTFEKIGKVASIKPKLWEGTSICSDNWLVTFDVTEQDALAALTGQIPRLVTINGDRVYVTWKEAPKFCTFCRKSGHKRADCNDLKNANKSVKDIKPKQTEPQAASNEAEVKENDQVSGVLVKETGTNDQVSAPVGVETDGQEKSQTEPNLQQEEANPQSEQTTDQEWKEVGPRGKVKKTTEELKNEVINKKHAMRNHQHSSK